MCVCVCECVWLQIYPPSIKLTALNFARRFIGIQGRESYILENVARLEAQNLTNRGVEALAQSTGAGQRPAPVASGAGQCQLVDVGSAFVDIGQSPLTYMCSLF